jgi:hypothetical protein
MSSEDSLVLRQPWPALLEAEDAHIYDALMRGSAQHASIEFGGFLTNHLAHGVLALRSLGASADRIRDFADAYASRLEPPSDDDDENGDRWNPTKIATLRGTRRHFSALYRHFEHEIATDGDDGYAALHRHLGVLIDGLAGAAFHALIHAGYAAAARLPRLTAEALACELFAVRVPARPPL